MDLIEKLTDIDYLFNPDKYDLKVSDMVTIACVSTGLLTTALVCGLITFGSGKEKRKLAWCISLLNSIVLTIASVFYLVGYVIPSHPGILKFEPNEKYFHGINNAGMALTIWFTLANILDMGYGLIFYRDKLEILSTFVR